MGKQIMNQDRISEVQNPITLDGVVLYVRVIKCHEPRTGDAIKYSWSFPEQFLNQ